MTENTRQNENGQKNTQCTKNLKKEKKRNWVPRTPQEKEEWKKSLKIRKG